LQSTEVQEFLGGRRENKNVLSAIE